MTTKIRLTIEYNTESADKLSEVMSGLDLGISRVICSPPLIINYTTTSMVTREYIRKLKANLKKCHKKEGVIIYDIKAEIIKEL